MVEFFPPVFSDVSVGCRSTSINVNNQVTKPFPWYQKHLVQLVKYKISSPEYLMVDMKCTGTSPANGTGWLIVYGVAGTHLSVPSTVLDRMFTIGQLGKKLMEVDINANQNKIFGLPSPTGNQEAANK